MRLIEFDKARRAMLKELEGRIGSIGALRIIGALESITIEAEPVKHGRWEKHRDDVCYWYECSECHEPPAAKGGYRFFSDYCPNCGAKMGGSADE